MAISFTAFFTQASKFWFAADTLNTALKTTWEDEVEDAIQAITETAIEFEAIRDNVFSSMEAHQAGGASANQGTVVNPVQQLLIGMIDADNKQVDKSATTAVKELIRQMIVGIESVDASTASDVVAVGGSNTGDGALVTSVKRSDGKNAQFSYAEVVELICTKVSTNGEAIFTVKGEVDTTPLLHPKWPSGSGTSRSFTSYTASSGQNIITSGTFKTQDPNEVDLPNGWIAPTATFGTTLKITEVEVQTVIMSSSPSAGHYVLHWTDRDSVAQSTIALAYNASSSKVQAALRSLKGLEKITVSTSGTTPNFTHTITFTDVPNPPQLTSTDNTTGGSIAHATSTAGNANVARGARSLHFDGDGAQLTDLYLPLTTLTSFGQYAFNVLVNRDVDPISGIITVSLIDGIAGTIINDEEGTANSFTIDLTSMTTSFVAKNAVFRMPENVPTAVYLRVQVTTFISAGTSVFLDEMCLIKVTELYNDGPSGVIFSGRTDWDIDDTITWTVSNDRAGQIQEHMDRTFNLRQNRLILPSKTDASETQADTLIS